MDTSKLRNSCLCGNTIPYPTCCGRFSEIVTGKDAEETRYNTFRYELHELSVAMFHLRVIYQAYWDTLIKENSAIEGYMQTPDYARAIVENFFWDYFMQYSDARPILRTAREIGSKQPRFSHDLIEWSYSPLWLYRILDHKEKTVQLENVGNGKIHTVFHSGRMGKVGEGVLTRLLPFRDFEYCGHSVLVVSKNAIPKIFSAACKALNIKPTTTLRPDVHCNEWKKHGALYLELWHKENRMSVVNSNEEKLAEHLEKEKAVAPLLTQLDLDQWMDSPHTELNEQTPRQSIQNDWGRQKVKMIVRAMVKQGREMSKVIEQLGLKD